MTRMDFKIELRQLYQASAKEVTQIEVPELRFVMVDGQGDPNTSPAYAEAVEVLFSVSYTAKFIVKKGPKQIDYAVMPLEGLWWADDMADFSAAAKNQWRWTMMIMQPGFVTNEIIDAAMAEVEKKKHLPGLDKLRMESFTEGLCAQVLHIGPFSEEGPTIKRLHEFIDARSSRTGKHHEIYLSDIRRTAPEKWKTILRQPMK